MILGIFDINYYYGDSNNDSWIVKTLPVLIGAVLGFGLVKLSDIIARRKAINRAGTDLINEINLLKSPIEKQITSLDALVTELKIIRFAPPKLELNFLLNTKRIELIDRNNAMEYFTRHYKGDRKQARQKLNTLYVVLDIIAFESKRIEKLWEYYLETGTVHFKEWKRNLDALITYCSICFASVEAKGGNPEEDAFVHGFFTLTNEQIIKKEDNPDDIFVLRENFHKPLAELGATHRTDERVEKLRMLNYQCNQAINELEELKEECALKFDRISKGLAKQYSKLETEISL